MPDSAVDGQQTEKQKKMYEPCYERPVEFTPPVASAICSLIASTPMSLQQICENDIFPTLQTALNWLAVNDNFALSFSLALDRYLANLQIEQTLSARGRATNAVLRKLASTKFGETNALAIQIQVFAQETAPQVTSNPGLLPLADTARNLLDEALDSFLAQADPLTLDQILLDEGEYP